MIGYYTTQDGPLSAAGDVYLNVLKWVVASYLVVTLIVRVLSLSAPVAVTALAGTAAALYYWYAGPLVATTLGMAEAGTWAIRGAAWLLIAVWLWRGLRRPGLFRIVEDRRPAESQAAAP